MKLNLNDPKKRKQFIYEICQYELRLVVATGRIILLKKVKAPKHFQDQCFADTMGWGINGNDFWVDLFRLVLEDLGNEQ